MTEIEWQTFQALIDRKDFDGALEYLCSRDREVPGRVSVLYHIGYVHRLMNNFEAAIRLYTEALDLDPTVATIHVALGIVFQQRGDYESAVRALNRAIELEPQYPNAWNSLGLTLKMTGDVSGALTAYKRAQEILAKVASERAKEERPDAVQTRLNDAGEKGLVLTDEYFLALKTNLRSDLMYATVMNNIGDCYLELGRMADARNAFLESIEFIPDGSS